MCPSSIDALHARVLYAQGTAIACPTTCRMYAHGVPLTRAHSATRVSASTLEVCAFHPTANLCECPRLVRALRRASIERLFVLSPHARDRSSAYRYSANFPNIPTRLRFTTQLLAQRRATLGTGHNSNCAHTRQCYPSTCTHKETHV